VAKKKHLQACEVGGSIYGKKQAVKGRKGFKGKLASGEDLGSAYDKLYKTQLIILHKLFRRQK